MPVLAFIALILKINEPLLNALLAKKLEEIFGKQDLKGWTNDFEKAINELKATTTQAENLDAAKHMVNSIRNL